MRRNTRYILKLVALCAVTIAMTFATFRLWHNMQNMFEADVPQAQRLQRPRSSDGRDDAHQIDYHDYKFIATERARVGIGEQGEPAFLSGHDEDERRNLFDMNGFNALLSDQISLNRSVKDIRHKE